jgi:hypothetical protein
MSGPVQTPTDKFRNKVDAVLNQLESWSKSITAEQSSDLKKLKLKYQMAMMADPVFTIKHFLDMIEPYAHQIMKGDEQFFLQLGDDSDSITSQIKGEWPGLSGEQRERIKNDLKLLLMLATIATKNVKLKAIIDEYRETPLSWHKTLTCPRNSAAFLSRSNRETR